MDTIPFRFIDEPIQVRFNESPAYEKAPPGPDGFEWRGVVYTVVQLLEEWHDFTRRGRYDRNMAPGHGSRASIHGSWGVGKYKFHVVADTGQIFELVYDRAPEDCSDRKGNWFLMGERIKRGTPST
jgi:hypothetical protein